MVEEVSEADARAQLETNLFGALWVTQAALPIMREQRSGHIIQVSSIGGVNAFPMVGLYHASKWGLEGMSQALAQEVAGFGIHVTLVEPTGFSTDWSGPSSVQSEQNPAYAEFREQVSRCASSGSARRATRRPPAPRSCKVVDADEPPLRVFFGVGLLDQIKGEYGQRIENWERWDDVAVAAHGLEEEAAK